MTFAPCPAEPPVSASAVDHDAYYRGVLHELIEMGMDLARAAHREVVAAQEAEAEAGVGAEMTGRFERVSRCVRRSILLARTLDVPVVARGGGLAAGRRRVLRAVEDRIDGCAEGVVAERLHGELLERLDGPELDEEILSRPVDEVIRDICRDLGLEDHPGLPPRKRRSPADVALLSARAGLRGRGWVLQGAALHPEGDSHPLHP